MEEWKMVEVTWLGQMGFLIKAGSSAVCIDYFASPHEARQTPALLKADALRNMDVFLGTHDHIDHMDHGSWRNWAGMNPSAKFVFPEAHREKVLADGVAESNALGMNDGDTVKVGEVTIHAVAAAHEFLDLDPQTGLYPYLQYIMEADGVRIHHAGDTVRYEGMLPKLRAFGEIDLQLLPINGRDAVRYRRNCIGNMTYQEAADLAGETGAAMVIPGHWDMFADNSEDPRRFADYLEVKYGGRIKCVIPKVMETIRI